MFYAGIIIVPCVMWLCIITKTVFREFKKVFLFDLNNVINVAALIYLSLYGAFSIFVLNP